MGLKESTIKDHLSHLTLRSDLSKDNIVAVEVFMIGSMTLNVLYL